ncbi:MAG: hypothetical protein EXR45_09555, partial [Chloroflexi bacterium]|nr:hypothetical protein [Chloroflexota bacterium]
MTSGFPNRLGRAIAVALAILAIVATSRIQWDAVATTGVQIVPATGVEIAPATGGESISIDTTTADGGSGACTPLSGPVLTERAAGDIASPTMSLTLPEEFEFCPGGTAVVTPVGQPTTLTLSSSAVTRDGLRTVSVSVSKMSTANSVGR